jgi:hypothetical protein
VIRWNGVTNKADILKIISTWAGEVGKSRREVSLIELLSKIAGVETAQFVHQHSTLPLRRSMTSYQTMKNHNGEDKSSHLWSSGMRRMRPGAYFCAACVAEDQRFHGYSYWRRYHQILGMYWCSKHLTALNHVDDESAFFHPPSTYADSRNSVSKAWVYEAQSNKTIRRYLDICSGLMELQSPLDSRSVSLMLRGKASEQGYQIDGRNIKNPLLSDKLINCFGRDWLDGVNPILAKKPIGAFLRPIDCTLFIAGQTNVTNYILACAVLFETTDDALNGLISTKGYSARKVVRLADEIDREFLHKAYIQARGSHAEVGKTLLVNKQALAARFRAMGLPSLNEGYMVSKFKAAISFFIEEDPHIKSMEISWVSRDMMENMLRFAGARLRSALIAIKNNDLARGQIFQYHNNRAPIGGDILIKSYIMAQGSHSEVASTMQVDKSILEVRLIAAGLPDLKEALGKNKYAAAVAFLIENRTLAESSARGNLNMDEMESLLRCAGVSLTSALKLISHSNNRGVMKAPPPESYSYRDTRRMASAPNHAHIRADAQIIETEDQNVAQ